MRRIVSQRIENTHYWGRSFLDENPGWPNFPHQFSFDVYQSPDFPHVFLGGDDELEEAEAKAGQPVCKVIDCRDLPELDATEESPIPAWDYSTYLSVQSHFNKKVQTVIQAIESLNCPIYVHCAMGANRSVSVLSAALSSLTNRSVDDILTEMKKVRGAVSPQDPFYLMALDFSSPETSDRRFMELDQDFPLLQPGISSLGSNWLTRIAMQKTLIISRGPSGSGKSVMSRELAQQFNAPIFSTDDFFMVNGEYRFDGEFIGDAHFWNQLRVEKAMEEGEPVIIVDNTNTRFGEMKPYVEMASRHGYTVQFKEPDWNPGLKTPEGTWNVDFLQEMQNQGDRDKVVPDEAVQRMVDRYEYNPTVERVLQSRGI